MHHESKTDSHFCTALYINTVEPHLSNPHLSNLLSQPTNPPPQNMYIFSLFCKAQYEKLYIIMALMVFLLSFNAFLQVKEGI